ncbi:MAG: ABC transporter ATP-binding protein [Desulfarculus sp.]|nr:ABC transporter ATP-binding protein [Desulfarculus sp.]
MAGGEYLAIMGASGSGKSTLLTLLGCLDRPSRGSYHLAGQDVSQMGDRELSRLRANHIGFIFQTFNLLPQLTVAENVALPFLYRQQSPELVKNQVEQAIIRVGLGHRQDHRPAQLSGGEMQRVAIARALAIKPWLILADEPTGNLDSQNSQAILALFQELNSQGVTLVVVTHDPQVAARAGRTIHLLDGRPLGAPEQAP